MTPTTDPDPGFVPAEGAEPPKLGLAPEAGGLLGPVEVAELLGVKPQLIINWIREGRAHLSAVDALGRNRFTRADVESLRSTLGRRRTGSARPETGSEGHG